MPRIPLPSTLADGPFTVAEARRLGLGRGRVSGRDLERPFHGVREFRPRPPTAGGIAAPPPTGLSSTLTVCRAFLLRMPGHCFFSHQTAAVLWGFPLPRAAEAAHPVHVSALVPAKGPRARGVVGHRLTDPGIAPTTRFGMPVPDALSTWLQLGAELRQADLVAAGDHLLRPFDSRPGIPFRSHSTPDAVSARVLAFRGHGKSALMGALPHLRVGAESRRETFVRLALVRAGLPEPVLNPNLFDATGSFVARIDLDYPDWKVSVEYDGEQHRTDDDQYHRDLERLDAVRLLGREVVVLRKQHLRDDATSAVDRVTAALRRAGWRS
jgi:hypothetical protein